MKLRLSIVVVVLFLLIVILPFFVSQVESDTSTIWTDKADYGPGETVTIFGSGFLANKQVAITITAPDSSVATIYATTDGSGAFTAYYTLDGMEGTYTVTATDGTNTATTTFLEPPTVDATWSDSDCAKIKATASGLSTSKCYYVTYADPDDAVRRTSPTYTGVSSFIDYFVLDITLPKVLGTWTVRLYETPATLKKTDTVAIDKMVWTTDSTYAAMKTSFAQGETVYFKAIGLLTNKYYNFRLDPPVGSSIYVGAWTTGVTTLTGSYALPSGAPTGEWKLHVRQADNAAGGGEKHYVDRYFTVTVPTTVSITITSSPVTGSGFVKVDGTPITTSQAFTWTIGSTHTLEALSPVAGPTGTQYVWTSWSDGGIQTHTYTVPSVSATVTANYKTQYQHTITSSPATGSGYVTVDGSAVTTPYTTPWWDSGSSHTIAANSLVVITTNQEQYVYLSWSDSGAQSHSVSPTSVTTFTATFTHQWYFLVSSSYDSPTGTGWYNAGSSCSGSTISRPVSGGTGIQYETTGWTGTGSLSSGGSVVSSSTGSFTISAYSTCTWNWKTQYLVHYAASGNVLPVTVPADEWVNYGAGATGVFPAQVTDTGIRCNYVSDDRPSVPPGITAPTTVTATYQTQYYLTVTTSPAEVSTLNPAAVSGQGWYDSGATATVNAVQNVDKITDQSRYDFRTWTGATPTGVGNQATVLMDNSKTATANYKLQYKITFNQSGVGGDFLGTVVTVDTTNNYGIGSLPKWFWWDDGSTHTFAFQSPLVCPTSKQYVWANTTGLSTLQSNSIIVSASGSVTGSYKTQYYLTVTSPYGTSGGQDWYNNGDTAYATLDIGVFDHGNGTRRVFKNWNGDASGINYVKSDPIIMDGPKTATAIWKTQYKLTVRTSGLGTKTTNVYNGTAVLGTATDATPYADWFDKNAAIQLNIDTPISGSPTRYVFTQWTGDASGSGRPASVTMSSPKDITANYKTQYQITVAASPGGTLGGTFKVTYTQCGTTYTSVLKTTSWTEWVDGTTTVIVGEPQDIVNGYKFDSYNPSAIVTMDQAKTITLIYTAIPPFSVTISPTSATIKVGESVTFTSTVSGGVPGYSYQWYRNGTAVSGAIYSTWTFTPATSGTYNVYLNVTDSTSKTAKSNTASVTVAPPLTVSISPTSASILVGQSVTFTSSVSGGYPPYSYQWYLGGVQVSGATSNTWTFTPTASGIYYVYLQVKDANNNIAQSETARITVITSVPVGGYSISLAKRTPTSQIATYTLLIALFGVALSLRKRKRK